MKFSRLAAAVVISAVYLSACAGGCGEKAKVLPTQGPLISGIKPAQGPTAGGTVLLIKGQRFAPEAVVLFGKQGATKITVADAETMTAVVPAGEGDGPVDVQVQNSDGNVFTFNGGFTYYSPGSDALPAPVVTQISPNQGPLVGGALIEVRGDSFQKDAQVFIGGRPAQSVTFVSAQLLTAITPAGVGAGAVEIAVTNPDGLSARLDAGYAYATPSGAGPRISSIVPNQGSVLGGAELRISGADFQTGVRIYVGGRPATGIALLGNELISLSPAGEPGLQDVAVVNPDGQTALAPRAFNYYTLPPILTAITPIQGPKSGGTDIVIQGRGFDQNTNVLIDGKPVASLNIVDDQSATAKTPVGEHGGYVDAKVVSANGLSDTAKGGFYYIDADHPPLGSVVDRVSIIRVSPSSGPATGGTAITLLGTGFKSGATVTVGGKAATDVRVLGPTAITAKTPSGTVGPALVEVENPDGLKAQLNLAFSYYGSVNPASAPQLSGITPNTGPTTGQTHALLTGTNFKAGVRVFLGADEATSVTVVSTTQLSFVTPAVTSPGPVNVTVLTTDGLSGQLTSGFVYYDLTSSQQQNAPVLTDLTPPAGPAGVETQVLLAGDKFQVGALVFFGDQPASGVTVESATGIRAITPKGSVGPVDVTVTNPDGLSVTKNAGYNFASPAPAVSSITPNKGPLAGGITALIVGTGFVTGAEVLFGSTPSNSVQITDTTVIRAVVPPNAAGTVDITVRNPDGQQSVLANAFTFDPNWTQLPAPSLDQIVPARGPSTGGTVALLRGQNFVAGATVFFGGAPGTEVVVSSSTEASVKVPAGAEGAVHVSFTNPDGQSSVLAAGFTYVNPSTLGTAPKLTGVTPTAGPETATTNVLVTGQNLKANALIFFGGVLAKNPVLLSSNIYSAQTEPHAPGQVSVSITQPDGQSFTLANAFTYVAAPTVTGVLPASGKSAGGTSVTLSGTGFQPGATVKFGTASATSVTVASSTVITCVTPAGTAGLSDITVTNPDGQWGTLTGGFSYVPPPSFSSTGALVPAQGPSTGGSIIELHGDGFQNGATVNVRGTAAQVQFIDSHTIVISTPAGTVGTADIQITNPDGQTTTLTGAFTYKDPASLGAAPTLTAPTPAAGPDSGNSRVIVNGGNFADGARVFFGMEPGVQTAYVNPAAIGTTTPAHAAGKVVLAVTNPDGQTARLTDGFEFKTSASLGPAPTITLITPQSASRFGGTSVSVDGTNFLSGAVLFLGGVPASNVTTNGTTQLNGTAPAHDEGPALVQVTNPDGQTATFAGTFQFVIPPPQLSSVNPASGPTQGGTSVELIGSDMHPNAVVTFGANTATCTWVSSGKLTCTTPAGSNGPVAVKVTNPDGKFAQLAGGFTYAAPPVVSSVSPTSGPEAGGTRITLTGQNFKTGAAVEVGGVAATAVTFISATALQATTPAGTGPAAVKVINPDSQSSTLAGGFTYLPPVPPPAITGISPNYGPDTGGTNVTLSGSGFQAGAQVFFGANVSTTVQVFSPTYINAVAPAGTVGTVDVKIVNPDQQEATKPGGYQYIAQGQLPPLAVDQVNPGRGPTTGGNVVTVLGRGFKVGAIVAIGGNACTSPQYIGPGAINCTAPAGVAGPAPVVVTNPGGTSATLNAGYIYGDGGSFVVAPQRLRSESLGGKLDTVLMDVDGDGDLDQISTYDTYNRVEYNDGTGNFLPGPNQNLLQGGSTRPHNQYTFVIPPTDLTGDGKPDLFVRGLDGNVASCWGCGSYYNYVVYKNNGGTFTEIQRFGDSSYMNGVWSVADLDNDGDKDLVWGRDAPNADTLWKNNGSGVFTQVAGIPAIADNTRAICIGDVDKDGDQDLFLANDNDQQKRLYLNNGTGTFTDVSSTYLSALGGNSQGCAIADIDKDNDLDIFIINNGQQDRLYVNDGTGHYTDGTLGRMPQENDDSSGAQLVDIDFDGDLDLISRVGATKHERIYLSDGNGQFVPANTDLVPAVIGPDYWWRIGDLNNDGFPDEIRAHQGGQNRLLLNQPNGSGFRALTDRTMISFPSDWRTISSSAFADVDNDGDQDLIAGEEWTTNTSSCTCMPWGSSCCAGAPTYDGRIHLYLNDGSGNFFDYSAARLPPNISVKADAIAVADFDGVNGLDFAVNDRSGSARARLFLNDGTGNFTERSYPNFPSSNTQYTGAITVTDLDADGRPDLLLGSQTGVRYWRNVGGAYFIDMSSTVMPAIGNGWNGWISDIRVGDLDNDGDPDLFVSRPTNNQIIKQDPGFIYTDYTSLKMPSASSGTRSYLFDADNDGDLDAYVANCSDDRLYLNTGGAQGGYMADNTNTNLPRVPCSDSAAVLDINGDGLLDLFIGKNSGASGNEQDRLLINGGAGAYTDQTSNRVTPDDDYTRTLSVADVNGDGRLDLFIGNSGQSRIYRGVP